MPLYLTNFSKLNRQLILLLMLSYLLWCCGVFVLLVIGKLIAPGALWLSGGFIALQLYAATQLLVPALQMVTEKRNRSFYLFWGSVLALSVWLVNTLPFDGPWLPLLEVVKSGQLLFVGTLVGAVLGRYVQRLWEIVPICIMMTLADVFSWLFGPTAGFTQEIQKYYQHPDGPPPIIDMVLVKLALPGVNRLVPVFGISDWIMVVFFIFVASRFGVNDNLLGRSGVTLAEQRLFGGYLPVSVVALFVAIQLAQLTGVFIPVLPLIAVSMLLWYGVRYLLLRQSAR